MIGTLLDNLREFLSHGGNIAFAVLAVIMISSAVFMISYTKIVHMVVSLALVFLSMAGLFVMLQAEFVAVVQVLIYAGAVSILMIFGIMMTRHDQHDQEPRRPAFQALLFIGVLAFFGIIFYAIQSTTFAPSASFEPALNNTQEIGKLIYHEYVIPFELVSVLLTVAFIGSIVMAKREED